MPGSVKLRRWEANHLALGHCPCILLKTKCVSKIYSKIRQPKTAASMNLSFLKKSDSFFNSFKSKNAYGLRFIYSMFSWSHWPYFTSAKLGGAPGPGRGSTCIRPPASPAALRATPWSRSLDTERCVGVQWCSVKFKQ